MIVVRETYEERCQCALAFEWKCPTKVRTLEVVGESIRLGRDSECEVAVDPVAFPTVSGVHARIEVGPKGFVLVHLSQSNKTLINDDRSTARHRSRPEIGFGWASPARRSRSWPSHRWSTPPPAGVGGFGQTVQADVRHIALLRGSVQADALRSARVV